MISCDYLLFSVFSLMILSTVRSFMFANTKNKGGYARESEGSRALDEGIQCRVGNSLLLPSMLLFRPPRGGNIPKQRLIEHFAAFSRGECEQLLIQSEGCDEAAAQGFQRRRRTHVDTLERRADRAQSLTMVGEVSSGCHAMEGAPLAPGTQRTLEQLRDPVRRPTTPHAPLPEAHQKALNPEPSNDKRRLARSQYIELGSTPRS